MVYFILILLLLFLVYKYDYLGHKINRRAWYFFIYLLLILLAGLRYRVGVDTIRYEVKFEYVPRLVNLDIAYIFDNTEKLEPLSALLFSLSKTIFGAFWGVQLLQATLVCIIISWFIKRNTNNIFTATFFFYITLYLNFTCEVMREACAVSIFLIAWEAFKGRRWLKYYILSTLAVGFHLSAIVLYIVPLLLYFNISSILSRKRYILLFIVFCVIIGKVLQISLFDYLQLFYINDTINDRAMSYQDTDLAGSTLNIMGLLTNIPKFVIYPLGAALIYKKQSSYYSKDFCLMCLLAIGFSIITLYCSLFYRFNNYFMPFVIIILSSVSFYSKQGVAHNNRFMKWCLLIFPFVFMYFYSYMADVGNSGYKQYSVYYPYKSIIFQEKDNNREQIFNYYGANQ